MWRRRHTFTEEEAMLHLTRNVGERIQIGADITIELSWVRGNSAGLGIDAPKDVPIFRQEVADRIRGKPSKETLPVDGKLLDSPDANGL